jgi:hypothetical protein
MGKSNKKNNRLEPTRSEIRGAKKNWTAYALLFIALAGGLAYANTLDTPLIFSDRINIESNMSLRSLKTAFSVPADSGLAGRPFVNFTFAVNYAVGGEKVAGYHLVNILIQVLSPSSASSGGRSGRSPCAQITAAGPRISLLPLP